MEILIFFLFSSWLEALQRVVIFKAFGIKNFVDSDDSIVSAVGGKESRSARTLQFF